ncbi:hypothetical protein CSB69_3785 [Morganella morganii]|nr:hypothetical protein CSB69_3785 [Morganella morganii]EMP51839.1 hypothetical protein C790_00738 [Morganella morganii SC01]
MPRLNTGAAIAHLSFNHTQLRGFISLSALQPFFAAVSSS